jgi:ankyrin repeat protein
LSEVWKPVSSTRSDLDQAEDLLAEYGPIRGDLDNVTELLESSHDFEACDPENGRTRAIFAAFLNHPQILELLLNQDASITPQDRDGRTALHFAASEGSCK